MASEDSKKLEDALERMAQRPGGATVCATSPCAAGRETRTRFERREPRAVGSSFRGSEL